MDAHDFIGQILVVILTVAACFLGVVVCLIALGKSVEAVFEFRESDVDVIGSHLVNEKGEWDFSRVDAIPQALAPRALRDTAPLDDDMELVEYAKDEAGNIQTVTRDGVTLQKKDAPLPENTIEWEA